MSEANQDEMVGRFVEITGTEENVAKFYLSSSNWLLEDAIANFLGTQGDGDNIADDEDNGAATGMVNLQETSGKVDSNTNIEPFGSGATKKPKFLTMTDMTKQPPNEEEGQAFYAGGSERSGQQVLGPPKRKNVREQLTDMFRLAQDHNQSEHAAGPSPSTSKSSGSNWGQGMRLGMTDSDHTAVAPPTGAGPGEKKPIVVLKLWSQGFSINDGELRLYDDEDNKEFLETVMRGEIPPELLEMGWVVNVDVEDHRHEDFKKKNSAKTFKGSGHTLGSPAPNVEDTSVAVPSAPSLNAENSEETENIAKEKLKVNEGEPVTTLQIRLADGSRLAAQFNLTHTVGDIHEYIQNARPQYANRNFILVSSFPTRELKDNAATIEVAGLNNAAVMQRLI